jgi:20S proteasome subunit beta 6
VLASSGFYGDITNLNKRLHINLELYKHQHGKEMSCPALAQMLSTTLYYKRFFPYYTFNILGGLDEQGRAAAARAPCSRGRGSRAAC